MRYIASRRIEKLAARRGLLVAAAAALAGAAAGDTVRLRGRPAFERVEVLTYKQGIVQFRGLSKQTIRKPVTDIESLSIDGMDSFNSAEAAASAQRWNEALSAYDAAAKTANGWLAELIAARRLAALDASAQFDLAVEAYVAAVRSSKGVGLTPRPSHPAPTGSPQNRAARETLEQAVRISRNPDERRNLRSLLLEVLLVDDQMPSASSFPPPNPGAGTPQASQPLRPRRIRLDVPAAPSPAQRSASVTLPSPTMVRTHVLQLLNAGAGEQALRAVERALLYAGTEDRPAWTVLLGRARIESGKAAEAASDLMKLAENAPSPAIACEALYYAAVAHERLDRPDVAATLYRELRDRDDLPAELREPVAEGLDRVD